MSEEQAEKQELWQRFASLFAGYEKAYGQFTTSRKNDKGKLEGRASTKRGVATSQEWKKHLNGEYTGMGQIPLRSDDTVVFAAIDIDVYQLDFDGLEKAIKKNKFPLVICKSKSAGAHCYVFLKEPTDADVVRKRLAAWAATLGFGGVEVFPKQSYRAREDDIGNWINLPYYHARETTRTAYKDGKDLNFMEFLDYAESMKQDPELFGQITTKAEEIGDDEGYLEGAPPCLCHIAATGGIPEGMRNETMFNFAAYLRKRFPDDWQDRLPEYNTRYCTPQLKLNEIQALAKSIDKKEYDVKCSGPHCDKKKCRLAKFGIGETVGGNKRPEIGSLTKYEGDPVYWAIEIDGQRVLCETDTLINQGAFNKLCMETINRVPGSMPKNRWEQYIDGLLVNVDIVPVPEDASKKGQFYYHLEVFCTGTNRQARSKDEIKQGKPYRHEGNIYFLSASLIDYLQEKRFKFANEHQIWQWLRERGADKQYMGFSKGVGGANVWFIEDVWEKEQPKDDTVVFDKEEF